MHFLGVRDSIDFFLFYSIKVTFDNTLQLTTINNYIHTPPVSVMLNIHSNANAKNQLWTEY